MALLLTTSKAAGRLCRGVPGLPRLLRVWDSVGRIAALVATYTLCIPWDFMLVRIIHAVAPSYLSGRTVGLDFGVTLGAMVRPALLLAIEFGLVAASLTELVGCGFKGGSGGSKHGRPGLRSFAEASA